MHFHQHVAREHVIKLQATNFVQYDQQISPTEAFILRCHSSSVANALTHQTLGGRDRLLCSLCTWKKTFPVVDPAQKQEPKLFGSEVLKDLSHSIRPYNTSLPQSTLIMWHYDPTHSQLPLHTDNTRIITIHCLEQLQLARYNCRFKHHSYMLYLQNSTLYKSQLIQHYDTQLIQHQQNRPTLHKI